MKKYVLGAETARKVKQLLNTSGSAGSSAMGSRGVTDPVDYAAPYAVTWAESVGEEGAWLIYLPDGSWTGAVVDEEWEEAEGDYPDGWYIIPEAIAEDIPSTGTASLYVDGSTGTIVLSLTRSDSAVHVADIVTNETNGEKTVKQLVRSVITPGATVSKSMPFDIHYTVEHRTVNGQNQVRLVYNIDWVNAYVMYNNQVAEYKEAGNEGFTAGSLRGIFHVTPWADSIESIPNSDKIFNIGLKIYDEWRGDYTPLEFGEQDSPIINGNILGEPFAWSLKKFASGIEPSVAGFPAIDPRGWKVEGSFFLARVVYPDIRQMFHGTQLNLDLFCGPVGTTGGEGSKGADEIEGSRYPQAFQYKEVESGGEVTGHEIANCYFYFDGALVTLSNYVPPATGEVYLNGVQEAPQSGSPGAWAWTLSTALVSPPAGGNALNFKLYTFNTGRVTCDYRTSFLTVTNSCQKPKLVIGKTNDNVKVDIDATAQNASVTITNGTKTIDLSTSDIPSSTAECSTQNLKVRTLKFADRNSVTHEYHVLSCEDIDLRNMDTGVTGIFPGENITETHDASGNYIISATGGGGGGGVTPEQVDAKINAAKVTVELVSDVRLEWDEDDNELKLVVTKSRFSALSSTTAQTPVTSTVSLPKVTHTAVISSAYNPSTHQFTNTKKTYTLYGRASSGTTSEVVFTAQEHET